MHMAGGGMHKGGRGDARASCASPLGTPLPHPPIGKRLYYEKFSDLVPIVFHTSLPEVLSHPSIGQSLHYDKFSDLVPIVLHTSLPEVLPSKALCRTKLELDLIEVPLLSLALKIKILQHGITC
jgi:hypothetical protein